MAEETDKQLSDAALKAMEERLRKAKELAATLEAFRKKQEQEKQRAQEAPPPTS